MPPTSAKALVGREEPSSLYIAPHAPADDGLRERILGALSSVPALLRAPSAPLEPDSPESAADQSPESLVPKINNLSAQVRSALIAGAASAAVAASPVAAQTSATASPAPVPPSITYSIKIEVTGGAQGQDIADEVRKAIEQIERERRGRSFGDD